jgi:hypothetical protein
MFPLLSATATYFLLLHKIVSSQTVKFGVFSHGLALCLQEEEEQQHHTEQQPRKKGDSASFLCL